MNRAPFFILKGLFVIIAILFYNETEARRFSGKITDIKGEGIPFATIYIQETRSGISSDIDGAFSTLLPAGKYTVEISSLGFSRERLTIEKGEESIYRTFVLDEVSYELREATLSGRDDDRGTSIMKRAIAMAPRYRYQVREYEADSYLKGTVKINKIPAILKVKSIKEMANFVTGKLFVVESHSTIKFTFPNKYHQTVRAFSSSIPEEIDPGDFSMIMKSSIYDPQISGMVSPLSPNALSYYRFLYQGIANESGRVVNKILVVPKRGNSKLFAGHLYIVDNLWNVAYAELVTSQSGVNINIKINYNEVSEGVFLPTTYNIKADISTLGIKGEGQYFSSASYSGIKTNASALLHNGSSLPSQDSDMKKRDASRIAKNLERDLAPKPTEEPSLELKRAVSNTTVVVDSTAKIRDSLYWLEVRRVPLRGDEVVSYQKRDSLKFEFKEIEKRDSVRSQNSGRGVRVIEKIFFGHKFKLADKLHFTFGGLSKVVGDFNFVDGYQFGQNISLQYGGFKNAPAEINASAYYSSERNVILWNTGIKLSHSPLHNGVISFEAGRESADISSQPGVSRFLNSYSSFLFGINPVKLLDKRFVSLTSGIDLANGLRSSIRLSASSYSPLTNGNVKSLFGKEGEENAPLNTNGGLVEATSSLTADVSLSYTHRYYYRIDKGYKRYVRSKYPTIALRYAQAFSILGFESSWSRLEASVKQRVKTDIYSTFSYSLEAGTYLSSGNIFLQEYKHFSSSNIITSEDLFDERYVMADGYLNSTKGSWLDVKLNYNSEYILLKRLPFLDTPMLTEAIHFKSLWLPDRGIHHSETGYSIGMDDVGRFGLFVSFSGLKYSGFGFRISLPLLKSVQ